MGLVRKCSRCRKRTSNIVDTRHNICVSCDVKAQEIAKKILRKKGYHKLNSDGTRYGK